MVLKREGGSNACHCFVDHLSGIPAPSRPRVQKVRRVRAGKTSVPRRVVAVKSPASCLTKVVTDKNQLHNAIVSRSQLEFEFWWLQVRANKSLSLAWSFCSSWGSIRRLTGGHFWRASILSLAWQNEVVPKDWLRIAIAPQIQLELKPWSLQVRINKSFSLA